jgi:hypothetical protein
MPRAARMKSPPTDEPKAKPAKASAKSAREARLAAALRANLKRRKAAPKPGKARAPGRDPATREP